MVSELDNEFSKIPELSTTVIFFRESLFTLVKKEIRKIKPPIKAGVSKVISKKDLFFTLVIYSLAIINLVWFIIFDY
jgi:hypothetical protein